MNNFDVFDKATLRTVLDPFAPSMGDYITPIKYEALTPDAFAFLFRTTARDGATHFFVLLQYDYMENLDEIKQTIANWHGPILDFWAPQGRAPTDFETEQAYLEQQSGKHYKTVLAHVEKPHGKGYWGNHITATPHEILAHHLDNLPAKQQAGVKKSITTLLKKHADLADKPLALYIRDDGRIELFYN